MVSGGSVSASIYGPVSSEVAVSKGLNASPIASCTADVSFVLVVFVPFSSPQAAGSSRTERRIGSVTYFI